MITSIAISVAIFIALVAGLIAFGGGSPPPTMASISEPFRGVDMSDVPAPERIGDLSVHVYPGGDQVVVVALHGSSAHGASLHPLSQAVEAAGATVYAPDLPGHGAGEGSGDVPSVDVFDSMLASQMAEIRERHQTARIVLLGFSSGGGAALRHARALLERHDASSGGAYRASFDQMVLVAPMLGPFAPTTTAENPFASADTWAKPYTPRLIGLSIANFLGIRLFDHLPVIGFAVQDGRGLTAEYSHRLLKAMNPADYAAELAAVDGPVTVLVGEQDEVFHAPVFAPTIHAVRPEAEVIVVPGMGHTDMTVKPEGLAAVVRAVMGE